MPDHRPEPDLLAGRASRDEAGWHVCSGLTMREMEQLLDWLEQCGCAGSEVQVDVLAATVRWRCDHHEPKRS